MNETKKDKKSYNKSDFLKKQNSGLSNHDRKMMSKFFSLGLEFAGVSFIFGFFGYKADQYFGTMPWLTLAGIFFALVGLVYQFIKDLGNLD